MIHALPVIASEARQSSALRQPLDCRVAKLLAKTSSLRAFASSREPKLSFCLTRSREGAKCVIAASPRHPERVSVATFQSVTLLQVIVWMLSKVRHDECMFEALA